MHIIKISNNIDLIHFKPKNESYVGYNMLLLKNEDECILIDTGYERHYRKIKDYIDSKGYSLKQIIISHFHNDHIGGLPFNRDIPIHGNIKGRDTLQKYLEEYKAYLPNRPIVGPKTIQFGELTIKIIPNKGHSVDGLIIDINNTYLYVGDDLILSHEGDAILPFCADQDFNQQLAGLKNVMKYTKDKVVIPAHGTVLYNEEVIIQDIENRIKYIEYFIQNPNKRYHDFEQETNIQFLGKRSHLYNMKQLHPKKS